jgi:plasmid maintenance system killer protein
MNVIFKDTDLKELYETNETTNRKYKKICRDIRLLSGYIRAVSIMYDVKSTDELKQFSFLHYEKLKHQKQGIRSSIRLANKAIERLIFNETANGIEVELLEIDDTHYGNKK